MSTLGGPTSLISLFLAAPHIAVEQEAPKLLHAVTADGLPVKSWPDGLATTACGVEAVQLLQRSDVEAPTPWPPRVRSLPEGFVRCAECYLATGRPRPRSEFRAHLTSVGFDR